MFCCEEEGNVSIGQSAYLQSTEYTFANLTNLARGINERTVHRIFGRAKDPAMNLNIHKQWTATPFLVETPLTLPLGTYDAQD